MALAIFAVLMSLIGAFYYLRVVKVMYFDAAQEPVQPMVAGTQERVVLSVNGFLVLGLGILPGGLMTLCGDAIARMLMA
jgi:NADH-quinone oxidoreductase subunit N